MVASDITDELPLETSGDLLRHAREAKGLTRADVSLTTRISERYITAFDESRYGELPGRAYAVGFARTYARAVGLDGDEVVRRLRGELEHDAQQPAADTAAYAPGDPSRLPSRANLWLGGLGAVIVVLLALVFWRHALSPAGDLPSALPSPKPAPALVAHPAPPQPAPASGPGPVTTSPASTGNVVFTAQADALWVKFSDADGKQLMQKQMKRGETYTVPADAKAPTLWTGSPEALTITVNGKPVPPLDTRHETVRHAPVSAAALLARPPVPAATTSTVSH